MKPNADCRKMRNHKNEETALELSIVENIIADYLNFF